MALSLASLLIEETKAKIYETALAIAVSLGLPVTSWQAGDPTRALLHVEAELLSKLESVVVGFIQSGFLDYATGVWLEVLAEQVYGVIVPPATSATTTVILTNGGGGFYPDLDAGDLTFKNAISGKTYRNTTSGTLASGVGQTLALTVVADEPGSDSSAAAGEINALVTTLLGVTVSNALAAVGVDKQSVATTRAQCRDKLGSLSPNGPKEAYSFVARDAVLSGTNAVTRVRVYSDSDYGDVTVYLAGPSGGVAEPDRLLVQVAILKWATPLCITPSVLAATNVAVPVSYQLWLYKSANRTAAEVADEVQTALENMFAVRPIGGDIIPPAASGSLYRTLIESTIRSTFPQAFRVAVTLPAGDTPIGNGEVATLGAVVPTIQFVSDP